MIVGTNNGHGHVWPRPDGFVARCGGPALCDECALDAAGLHGILTSKGISERVLRATVAAHLLDGGDGEVSTLSMWCLGMWIGAEQPEIARAMLARVIGGMGERLRTVIDDYRLFIVDGADEDFEASDAAISTLIALLYGPPAS